MLLNLNKPIKNKPIQNKPIQNLINENTPIYNETETIHNDKLCFRNICNIIHTLTTINIPSIKKQSIYEAVLIEFRILPHLDFLIKNTILHLGSEWSHTIICGPLNYNYMKNICNSISNNINVIQVPFNNLNQTTYSLLLASLQFWDLLHGNKILIYQEDSIIFKYNINDFLNWDYIGAPWFPTNNDTIKLVGNGGFSLRDKNVMIKTIRSMNIFNIKKIFTK
jgi:hypothetical protein